MSTRETPIVLLHGVGLDRTMWETVVEQLSAVPKVVPVAIDLPGHGARPPLRTAQTLASLADDVLSRLPHGLVHLVGFSLGALIAQHIARYAPDRVASLTSVNSVCQRTPEEAARVEARLATAGDDFAAGVEASIERWFPAGSRVMPETINSIRSTLLGNDVESYLRAYEVFVYGDRAIGHELGRITTPALAITGEHDPASTPEMADRLGAAMPNCRVQIVPNTKHMMPVEDPSGFVAALIAFLDDTSEGADND